MEQFNTHHPHSATDVCVTCLSVNRRLTPISSFPHLKNLCNGIELTFEDRVCWECKGVLMKLWHFQQKALKSKSILTHLLLNNEVLSIEAVVNVNATLSTFGFSVTHNTGTIKLENQEITQAFEHVNIIPYAPNRKVKTEIDTNNIPKSNIHADTKVENCDAELENDSNDNQDSKTSDLENDDSDSQHIKKGDVENKVSYNRTNFRRNEKAIVQTMSDKEMYSSRERRRQLKQYQTSSFKCERCVQSFRSKGSLTEHNLLHNNAEGEFQCHICEQRFISEDTLKKHTQIHYRYYQCRECSYTNQDIKSVLKHWKNNHNTAILHCNECPAEFRSPKSLRQHNESVHVKPTCDLCEKKFINVKSMKAHRTRHFVKAESFECKICNKKFRLLNKHMKDVHSANVTDTEREACFCVECNKHYSSAHTYALHLRTSLRHVTREHLKYICDDCDKRFTSKTALRTHIERRHIKKHDYVCNICGMAFTTKQPLQRHIQKKHSELPKMKRFFCKICGKCYKNRVSLTQHNYSHTDARPYKCRLCSATFNYSGALFKHNTLLHKAKKGCDSS